MATPSRAEMNGDERVHHARIANRAHGFRLEASARRAVTRPVPAQARVVLNTLSPLHVSIMVDTASLRPASARKMTPTLGDRDRFLAQQAVAGRTAHHAETPGRRPATRCGILTVAQAQHIVLPQIIRAALAPHQYWEGKRGFGNHWNSNRSKILVDSDLWERRAQTNQGAAVC